VEHDRKIPKFAQRLKELCERRDSTQRLLRPPGELANGHGYRPKPRYPHSWLEESEKGAKYGKETRYPAFRRPSAQLRSCGIP